MLKIVLAASKSLRCSKESIIAECAKKSFAANAQS
jgi:hypothetical protein